MVQPLPSSSCPVEVLPGRGVTPRPAAAPLILPARRSLEVRRRRRNRAAAFFSALRSEYVGAALTILILLSALVAMGWRVASRVRASAPTAATITLRVQSGDTLWSVARRYGPTEWDMAARLDAILRANRLPNNAVLMPGQTLRVPTGR